MIPLTSTAPTLTSTNKCPFPDAAIDTAEPEAWQKPPLETILSSYDFEKVAAQALSKKTWAFYSSAATDMLTRDANKSMMDRILLRPRVLRNVTRVDTRTKILGCQTGLPLFVSPAAMAKMVHPEGELAMARGCARYGVGQCVSIPVLY